MVCIVVGCWLLLSAVGVGAVGGTGGVARWGGVALTGRGGVALGGRGVAQLGGRRRFLALPLPLPRGGHRAAGEPGGGRAGEGEHIRTTGRGARACGGTYSGTQRNWCSSFLAAIFATRACWIKRGYAAQIYYLRGCAALSSRKIRRMGEALEDVLPGST